MYAWARRICAREESPYLPTRSCTSLEREPSAATGACPTRLVARTASAFNLVLVGSERGSGAVRSLVASLASCEVERLTAGVPASFEYPHENAEQDKIRRTALVFVERRVTVFLA